MSDDRIKRSEAYLDALFGEGMGKKHTRFVDHLESEPLRDALHDSHALESRTEHLSIEENYLLGMCVLLATRNHGPAAMFAKTLRHRGVSREKIMEAVARMSMWIGAVPAADAAGHIQRALREWDEKGIESMRGWFPDAQDSRK